jgi:hypothetical protein
MSRERLFGVVMAEPGKRISGLLSNQHIDNMNPLQFQYLWSVTTNDTVASHFTTPNGDALIFTGKWILCRMGSKDVAVFNRIASNIAYIPRNGFTDAQIEDASQKLMRGAMSLQMRQEPTPVTQDNVPPFNAPMWTPAPVNVDNSTKNIAIAAIIGTAIVVCCFGLYVMNANLNANLAKLHSTDDKLASLLTAQAARMKDTEQSGRQSCPVVLFRAKGLLQAS